MVGNTGPVIGQKFFVEVCPLRSLTRYQIWNAIVSIQKGLCKLPNVWNCECEAAGDAKMFMNRKLWSSALVCDNWLLRIRQNSTFTGY